MDKNVNQVFSDECDGIMFDAKLAKRIRLYQQAFVNKNEDHIRFFGGKYIGDTIVRFTDADRTRWFHEVLEVDEGPLADRLKNLPDINEEYFVSSDAMNLSCVWLAHGFAVTKALNKEQREEAMVDALLVMHFKFMTSLLAHYFRYPAKTGEAQATYDALSMKYTIKQVNSWLDLFKERCLDIIKEDGIHHYAIRDMKDDNDVVRLLNDAQGRVRNMLKNIYAVFMEIHESGAGFTTTSAVIKHDGKEILKDKTKGLTAYGRYINSIITDKNSFIRPELVSIIEKLQNTMDPRMFVKTLEWMSTNYKQNGAGDIEKVLNETLIHSFRYLSSNRSLVDDSSNLPVLLGRLKGVYMASRSDDPDLLSLRSMTEGLVTKATGNKNQSTIASVRTGIMLYIVLRAFTMRHYTR